MATAVVTCLRGSGLRSCRSGTTLGEQRKGRGQSGPLTLNLTGWAGPEAPCWKPDPRGAAVPLGAQQEGAARGGAAQGSTEGQRGLAATSPQSVCAQGGLQFLGARGQHAHRERRVELPPGGPAPRRGPARLGSASPGKTGDAGIPPAPGRQDSEVSPGDPSRLAPAPGRPTQQCPPGSPPPSPAPTHVLLAAGPTEGTRFPLSLGRGVEGALHRVSRRREPGSFLKGEGRGRGAA